VEAKELLGLDVGQAQTGIARASNIAQIAVPLFSVKTSQIMASLQQLTKDQPTEAIIVGLPRNLKSQETSQTKWVREWVKKAKKQIEVPFYWQDEALTSQQALSFKLNTKNSVDEHALAAAIILQDFLDEPLSKRVLC